MGFNPRKSADESSPGQDQPNHQLELDPETVKRIEYALKGTMNIDVSRLSLDDKLTLLIERYNRKARELQQLKERRK